MEAFAVESHVRALRARAEGRFEREIVAVAGVTADEGPREPNWEKIRSLPTLVPGGRLTAAVASQISRRSRAPCWSCPSGPSTTHGLTPRARIHHLSRAGRRPDLHADRADPGHRLRAGEGGHDPRSTSTWSRSTRRSRRSCSPGSRRPVPTWPRSTSTAAPSPSATRSGATGTRLMTTLLHELERTGGRYGLQTMCEGGGQANVTIIEQRCMTVRRRRPRSSPGRWCSSPAAARGVGTGHRVELPRRRRRRGRSAGGTSRRRRRRVAAARRRSPQLTSVTPTRSPPWSTSIVERFGRLDVAVNNAGGSPPADSATAPARFSTSIVTLNLLAALFVAQAANAVMQRQDEGGLILNIGSVSGMRPSPSTAAYGAAKAGLINLTETLAVEWGPKVRVNLVTAGMVRTEQSHLWYGGEAGHCRCRSDGPRRAHGRARPTSVTRACSSPRRWPATSAAPTWPCTAAASGRRSCPPRRATSTKGRDRHGRPGVLGVGAARARPRGVDHPRRGVIARRRSAGVHQPARARPARPRAPGR